MNAKRDNVQSVAEKVQQVKQDREEKQGGLERAPSSHKPAVLHTSEIGIGIRSGRQDNEQ
jgi:hypothetical protein